MDAPEAVMVVMGIVLVGLIGIVIYSAMQPPVPINAEDIYKYDGMKIQTTVTIDHRITDRTELEFIMLLPICTSTGKSTMCIFVPIPIYDDYTVYKIKEGYYIADKHGYNFQDGMTYEIIGGVEHDYDDEHLFCVVVYEVLEDKT